jgi:Gluconate 2-dehydrogenase subunit 3
LEGLNRRQFIKGASLLPLAAALPKGVLVEALADTSSSYRFFTKHQAEVIVDATARLIPGPKDDPNEAGHPGAREANVVRYIDTMLAAFTFHPPRIHAGGPYSNRAGAPQDDMAHFVPLPRMRRLGWEKRLKQYHRAYVKGIKDLDSASSTGNFATASQQEQDGILAQSSFTSLLFEHAIEGMYCVPEYGGNHNLVGWKDISFPGDSQPRGYTTQQVSTSDGPDPVNPQVARLIVQNFERAVRGVRLAKWSKRSG